VTGKVGKNLAQLLEKVAKKVTKPKKCQIICLKAQFESSKHLHKTTFETLKHLQQSPKCHHFLGYLSPKNHLGLKKVAKWQKFAPSSHPVQGTLT
jgi:hypothetical protein